jgi:hypothetical protein
MPEQVSRPASLWPADVSHLKPCEHCGAMNGRSASVCWSCEGTLSSLGPAAGPGPAAGAGHDDVRPPPGGPDPDPLLASDAQGAYPELIQALEDLAGPMAVANAREFADSDPMLPGLYSTVDRSAPTARTHEPAGPAARRSWTIVGAAVLLLLVAVATTVDLRALLGEDLIELLGMDGAVRRGGGAEIPRTGGRPRGDTAQSAPIDAAPTAGSRLGVGEALDAAARALAVPPGGAVAVARPPAASPPNDQFGVVPAPKSTRPVAAIPSTETPRGSARGATRSADAAVAVPVPAAKPDRPELARPLPVPPGPCTAAVEALGLCATPPTGPKE